MSWNPYGIPEPKGNSSYPKYNTPPRKTASQLAAEKQYRDFAKLGGEAGKQRAIASGLAEWAKTQAARASAAKQPRIKTGGTASVGGGGNPIAAMFAPLFANLQQQKAQANKRYEANRQQVTNIYGQIVGARTEDIPATEEAFKRLVEAAATRSEAVNTSIDTAEAERLQGNRAALQSMGLSDLSVPEGDFASQSAAMAQQTNELNSANWENMLSTMGATSQDIARNDITGYNYSMMEDIGELQANRENFMQDIGQQQFELQSQKAQASFEYQQAQQAAAAAAAAAQQRAKSSKAAAKEKQMADALGRSGPALTTVNDYIRLGLLDQTSGSKVINTINEWFTNVPVPPSGRWNAGSAKQSLLSIAGPKLSQSEQAAIQAIFDKMKW